MEEPLPQQDADFQAAWNDEVAQVLEEQRARVNHFVEAQRQRFRDAETRLANLVQEIADELDTTQQQEDLARREAEIGEKTERLESLKVELQELQTTFAQAQEQSRQQQRESKQELDRREAEMRESESQLQSAQQELDKQREQFAQDTQSLVQGRERLEERQRQLDADREELSEQFERSKQQRRQVAEQFKRQRSQQQERLSQLRSELEAARGSSGEINDEAARRELETVSQQRDDLQRQVAQLSGDMEQLRSAAPDDEAAQRWETEATELRRRLAEESDRIAELEAQLATAEARPASLGDGDGNVEFDDLNRRYEQTVVELRAERRRAFELEERLASSPDSTGKPDDEGAMDWEAQKRRLLASLEADFDEDDDDDVAERLAVEEVVRKTDAVIAKKERELQRLERLLEEQSSNLGSIAEGAAAVADVLDKDAVILQERNNLQELQDEWRQKLRQAEIDISMQRAQIARERANLQEKTRELEEEANRACREVDGPDGKKGDDKPQRGRWLSRLGLKDNDE